MMDTEPTPTTPSAEGAVVPADPAKEKIARRRKQLREEAEEARLFETLGSKVMRVKLRTLKALGDQADSLGLQHIGHGRLVVAAENAERIFTRCGDLAEQIVQGKYPADPSVLLALLELQRDFNKQIIETGEAHLKGIRQPESKPSAGDQYVVFPPGNQMVAVINPPKAPEIPNG